MKITTTILALIAAGFLGQTAFADDNGAPLGFTIVENGHGQYHYMYYPTAAAYQQGGTTVALDTNGGGVVTATDMQSRPLPDGGNIRFVIGTNQHAQPTAAYIPVSSNFAQAQQ